MIIIYYKYGLEFRRVKKSNYYVHTYYIELRKYAYNLRLKITNYSSFLKN